MTSGAILRSFNCNEKGAINGFIVELFESNFHFLTQQSNMLKFFIFILYCIVGQSETFVYFLIKTQTFELKVVIKMRKINWNSIWTIFIINDPSSRRRLRVSHFPAPTKIRKESSKKNNILRYESTLLIAVKKSWKTGQLMLIGN